MIQSIRIQGYRAFPSFSMEKLGGVNLLIGRNNTGKTSILEAIYLLAAQGEPNALWRLMARRGEQLQPDPSISRGGQGEADIRHLFHGHEIGPGKCVSMTTTNQAPARSMSLKIVEAKREGYEALWASMPAEPDIAGAGRFALEIEGRPGPVAPLIPLTIRGGLRPEMLQILNNMAVQAKKTDVVIPQFITTDSMAWNELYSLWQFFSLEPEEQRVIKALQIIDPAIEGISTAGVTNFGIPGVRSGFKVRRSGEKNTVPIGSLGEGIWRILAIAMMLSRAKNNILLIDEIDSGLHHSVMSDMWRMVIGTAHELNIQIFATTHSYDCVFSLARVAHEMPEFTENVSIHRIEADHKESIPFTEEQVRIAAARKLEIR